MQKNKLVHLVLAGFIVINASSVNAQVVEVDKKTRDRVAGSTQPNGVDPPKVKLASADPAVQTINFSVVSCKSPLDGIVKIEGVVKNIGKADFFYTGEDKIEVILFEEIRGAVPPKNVAPGGYPG